MLQDFFEGLRVLGFAAADWHRRGPRRPMPLRGGRRPTNPDREARPPLPPRPSSRPVADPCPVPTVQLGDRWLACASPRVAGKCALHGAFPPAGGVGNQP